MPGLEEHFRVILLKFSQDYTTLDLSSAEDLNLIPEKLGETGSIIFKVIMVNILFIPFFRTLMKKFHRVQ